MKLLWSLPPLLALSAVLWSVTKLESRLDPEERAPLNRAVKHLERAVDLDSDNQQANYYLSEAYRLAGRTRDAERLYEQAVVNHPEAWWAHFGLGRMHHEAGRTDAAISELSRAVELNPDLPRGWQLLGRAYAAADRRHEAIELFESELAAHPYRGWQGLHLCTLLIEEGRLDEAIAGLLALRSNAQSDGTAPLLARAMAAKARQELESGAYQRVVALYHQAVAAGVADSAMRRVLVDAYLAGGGDRADTRFRATVLAALEREVEDNPTDLAAIWHLGEAYLADSQVTKAIELYQKATALHPDEAEAHLRLGELLEDQGQLEKAAAAYQQAIDKDPRLELAYLKLGRVLRSQGKEAAALSCYELAAKRLPDSPWAHLELGRIYLEMARPGS